MAFLDVSRREIAAPVRGEAPSAARRAVVIAIRDPKTQCASGNLWELGLSAGIKPDALRALDAIATKRKQFRKGSALYRAGDPFVALHAIRLGSCKTTILAEDGREQITGYHMHGDIIGLDGIATEKYGCEAVALEDTEASALPFDRLEELARAFPPLQHLLHGLLSRGISHDQNMMLTLGSRKAEERLTGFLLNLSDRYTKRGYSSTEFVLRMTRAEIGSYLGLQLETISRLFSRLERKGLIEFQGRCVRLCDLPSLRQLAGLRG